MRLICRKDHRGDNILVAYCEGRNDAPSVEMTRQYAAERLPAFMVPTQFVVLKTLPTTPSGKIDFRALPEPQTGRARLENGYEGPRNEIEAALAEIWADVLGLDRVGIHDDFFLIGGHSLRATQVISRLQATLGIDLPVRRIFEASTIARLALVIIQGNAELAGDDPVIAPLEQLEDRPVDPFGIRSPASACSVAEHGSGEDGRAG